MKIQKDQFSAAGIKFTLTDETGKPIGRAFLYLLNNGLHQEPFGFLEDVYVEEEHRGKGYGTQLVKAVIEEARKQNCYKLLGTSRYQREKVHQWYLGLGFQDYGKEFRMDL